MKEETNKNLPDFKFEEEDWKQDLIASEVSAPKEPKSNPVPTPPEVPEATVKNITRRYS